MKLFTMCMLTLVFFISGCLKTRSELRQGEDRGEREAQVQTTAMQKTPPPPPPPPMQDEVDNQFRQLNGRIDALENQMSQLIQSQSGKSEQSTQKYQAYEEALKLQEQQIAALKQEVEALKAPPPEAKITGSNKNAFEVGESAFTAKEWRSAIVNFQKYREENPKGKNYPAATYKIGAAFMEMKMKDEAKPFFQEVVDKFPKSKEAKKASFRLKNM